MRRLTFIRRCREIGFPVEQLRALEREIAGFVERCDTACAGGPGPACVPLAELARRPAPARGLSA